MGDRTKIDWCNASWNPVTGCLHGCEYCYAHGIANRFRMQEAKMTDCYSVNTEAVEIIRSPRTGDALCVLHEPYKTVKIQGPSAGAREWTEPYPVGFIPTFHTYRLDIPLKWRTPRNIFVCSMADLFGEWVPNIWIDNIMGACAVAPQHRYLFLTKNPIRYMETWDRLIPKAFNNDHFWYGTTITRPDQSFTWSDEYNTFVSIEPIMEPFDFIRIGYCKELPKWIIVGAETGNRKGKAIPKKDWIDGIVEGCKEYKIPLFMKESLRGIMGGDFIQEFPWDE